MNGTGEIFWPATKCPRSTFAALYFASANVASQAAGESGGVTVVADLHLVLVGELAEALGLADGDFTGQRPRAQRL